MCIIACCPTLPLDEDIENMATQNPDGWGVMWYSHKSNEVKVAKRIRFNLNDYHLVLEEVEFPAVFHFRIATSGSVSMEYTQPFLIDSGHRKIGYCHNGSYPRYLELLASFGIKLPYRKLTNDTQALGLIASKYGIGWLYTIAANDGQKFALLDRNGYACIGNFVEDNGMYLSHTLYSPWPQGIIERYQQKRGVVSVTKNGVSKDYLIDDYYDQIKTDECQSKKRGGK